MPLEVCVKSYFMMIMLTLVDEFFWPDLSQFSYDQLGNKDHKYLYYIPNADHSLSGTDALQAVTSFYYGSANGLEMPLYNFTAGLGQYGTTLEVNVLNGKIPTKVLLWMAHSKTRDFRVETIGKTWESAPLEIKSDNLHWSVFIKNPYMNENYVAFFIELTFDNYWKLPISAPLKFTTSVYISPHIMPCEY